MDLLDYFCEAGGDTQAQAEDSSRKSGRRQATAMLLGGLSTPLRCREWYNSRMRLWSLHPEYLDAKGIVALWREGLLARKVLLGETKGYTNHPQLKRFRAHEAPLDAIDAYLESVAEEAERRGYNFDKTKIRAGLSPKNLTVTDGQMAYECAHLENKLKLRDPDRLSNFIKEKSSAACHPLFTIRKGEIEDWEIR